MNVRRAPRRRRPRLPVLDVKGCAAHSATVAGRLPPACALDACTPYSPREEAGRSQDDQGARSQSAAPRIASRSFRRRTRAQRRRRGPRPLPPPAVPPLARPSAGEGKRRRGPRHGAHGRLLRAARVVERGPGDRRRGGPPRAPRAPAQRGAAPRPVPRERRAAVLRRRQPLEPRLRRSVGLPSALVAPAPTPPAAAAALALGALDAARRVWVAAGGIGAEGPPGEVVGALLPQPLLRPPAAAPPLAQRRVDPAPPPRPPPPPAPAAATAAPAPAPAAPAGPRDPAPATASAVAEAPVTAPGGRGGPRPTAPLGCLRCPVRRPAVLRRTVRRPNEARLVPAPGPMGRRERGPLVALGERIGHPRRPDAVPLTPEPATRRHQ